MRLSTSALILLAATTLASVPMALAEEANPMLQGLVKVEGSKVDLVYQRPGTHWVKFKSVQLAPLIVTFRVYPEDAAQLQQLFAEEMRAELEKNRYAVVTAPRGDTLIIQARLNQIISNSLSIKLALTDAASHTVVAAASDMKFAQAITDDRESKMAQARAAFQNWAHILSDDLTALAAASDVNPEECFKYGKDCH